MSSISEANPEQILFAGTVERSVLAAWMENGWNWRV
jgi:hypothetical protein